MRWQDLRDGAVHVQQTVWEGHTTLPKTFQSQGAVPIIKPVEKLLDIHRIRCVKPVTGPMFAALNGKPVSLNNVLGRATKPALKKARLDSLWHGWHAARRSLGSNLYALGVSDQTIQVILRHANVSTTTSYYIKTAPSEAVAAMHKLETAIPALGDSWAAPTDEPFTEVAVN